MLAPSQTVTATEATDMAKHKTSQNGPPSSRGPGRPPSRTKQELDQATVVMKKELMSLIEDEMMAERQFNRNQMLRDLIVECLTARRQGRGLSTPEGLNLV